MSLIISVLKKNISKFKQNNTLIIWTVKFKREFQHYRVILHQTIKIYSKKGILLLITIIIIIRAFVFNPSIDNSPNNHLFKNNDTRVEKVQYRTLLASASSRPHTGAKSQSLQNLLNPSNQKKKLNINNKKKVMIVSPKWKQQMRKLLKNSNWEQRITKFESNLVRKARVTAYKNSVLRRPYRVGYNLIRKINPYNDNIILSPENKIKPNNQNNDFPGNKKNETTVQLGNIEIKINNIKDLTEKMINPKDVEIDMDKITPVTTTDLDYIRSLLKKSLIEFSKEKKNLETLTRNKPMTINIMNKKRILSAVENSLENKKFKQFLTEDSINKELKLDKIPTLDQLDQSNSLSLNKHKQQRYQFVIVTGSKPYVAIASKN
jgi:hypothetical protein